MSTQDFGSPEREEGKRLLIQNLKAARTIGDGKAKPAGDFVYPSDPRRTEVLIALRAISSFLRLDGVDPVLLRPLTWVVGAIADAEAGAANPLFIPKWRGRPPTEMAHQLTMAGACAAVKRLTELPMTVKAECAQIADEFADERFHADPGNRADERKNKKMTGARLESHFHSLNKIMHPGAGRAVEEQPG